MIKAKLSDIIMDEMIDEDPDYSDLGEFTDEKLPGEVIIREGVNAGEYLKRYNPISIPQEIVSNYHSRECRFFKPYAGGEKPGTKYFKKYGLQDWKRAEAYNRGDWCFIGIRAKIRLEIPQGDCKVLQTITSGGIWGIESDCGDDYKKQLFEEEKEQLLSILAEMNVEVEGE